MGEGFIRDPTKNNKSKLNCTFLVLSSAKCRVTREVPEEDRRSKNKLHGLSPRANYTDRATAACRRSDCQLLRIEGTTWSA
jgi:hypothetical protein